MINIFERVSIQNKLYFVFKEKSFFNDLNFFIFL